MSSQKVYMLPASPGNPYQRNLVTRLHRYGIEVIYLSALPGETWFFEKTNRKSIFHFHWLSPLYRLNRKTPLKFLRFAARIIIARLLGYKIVWTVHNIMPHEGGHRLIDAIGRFIMVRCANHVILHCEYAKSEFTRRFHRNNGLHIIPHGNYIGSYENQISQKEARKVLNLRSDSFVYLFFGNVRTYKGINKLIHLFQSIDAPEIVLLIAGRCNVLEKDSILRAIRADSRIRLKDGFIPQDEVHQYFSAADVLVAPFSTVLTSGSVILALSYGIPIIAPSLGCLPEVVQHQAGILYNPADMNEFNAALRAIRKIDLQPMRRKAIQIAASLDWKLIAQKTIQIYQS